MLESQIITDEKLPNIHPGEVLKEEFLSPMNVSAYRLAKEINVPETRISEINRLMNEYIEKGGADNGGNPLFKILWNNC